MLRCNTEIIIYSLKFFSKCNHFNECKFQPHENQVFMMCKWHLTHPLTSIMRTDRTDSITGCHRHCHILRGFQKSDCWQRRILLASFPPSFLDCLFLCLSCSRLPSMSSNCCLLWSDSWGKMKWFACCLLYCSENIYVMNRVHKNRGVVKEKAFVQHICANYI